MKKSLIVIVLAGFLAGCASSSDGNPKRAYGEGLQEGTTGVSTGADAGMAKGVTGSEWAPPP
ncbi:MAG: hypothetical protein ABSH34_25230 [Verrucomicrobiota bacterium]|jgi:hypothetical protein